MSYSEFMKADCIRKNVSTKKSSQVIWLDTNSMWYRILEFQKIREKSISWSNPMNNRINWFIKLFLLSPLWFFSDEFLSEYITGTINLKWMKPFRRRLVHTTPAAQTHPAVSLATAHGAGTDRRKLPARQASSTHVNFSKIKNK